MRWVLLLVMVVLMALAVVAIKLLPWWAVVVGFVGVVLVVMVGAKLLIRRLFVAPFLAKGRALEGATMVVHSVEPGEKPSWMEECDEEVLEEHGPEMAAMISQEWAEVEREAREFQPAYHWVEATITPQESKCGFTHWEPSELVLIAPEADPKDVEGEDVGDVSEAYIWADGAFHKDDDLKYEGEQRVRLLVGVEPHVRRARFKYYLCGLCEVEFPAPPPAAQPDDGGQILPPPMLGPKPAGSNDSG